MMFSYRIDDDDLGNWDRYKYSYVAQFGCVEGENTTTCAARIRLPREAGGNLRDDDGVTYFVYAEYRVVANERTIFIDKLEAINFDDKLRLTSATDRAIEFFADVLGDRHAIDFYERPADVPDVPDAWDYVGPPINLDDIDFEIKVKTRFADASDSGGKTIDFSETDEMKLTLAWFAPDPDIDMCIL